MGKVGNIFSMKLVFYLAFQAVTGVLVAIPTEDLIGPDSCPPGSYCIETEDCTNEFYTTKSGNPFFCGPRHSIDSKVCCTKKPEITLTYKAPPPLLDIDENEIEMEFDNTTSFRRSYPPSNTTEDDDEVEIVTITDIGNTLNTENSFKPIFMGENDTAQEQLTNHSTAISPEIDPSPEETTAVNEIDDLSAPPSPMLGEADFDTEQRPNLISIALPMEENAVQLDVDVFNSEELDRALESRMMYAANEISDEMQKFMSCPCAKGEKGDPGPKGEPGEPGKIIYIPIFVNTVASTGNPVPPPIHLSGGQPSSNLPHHPSPLIIPFNVPIPTSPPAYPVPPPVPATAQSYTVAPPTPPAPRAPVTIPNPVSVPPTTDDPQARLFRQTHMTATNPRSINRRL